MRPLRLKMTGFGPYRETNVIDMESLGRGGLYLITGDTGAGKTFIFDAITYALYGDMSGSGRDTKTVRSQYSADGDKTEVELVFEYCGRRYMVTRNPEYNRAKKSGEGFTKQTAGATLIKPDGSAVDGTSKVNEEIRNILGIDKEQFCSIAMIAQGEFRKVLNAGTDERQKLFRKLFNTQPYSMLADELKELSRRNQEKYNDSIRGINLCLSAVSCSFDESLSDELEELRERAEDKKAMSEEICELLGSIINKGTERAAHISEELAEVDNTLTGLNNTIALAKDHRKNVKSLEDARNAVPELDRAIDSANKMLDEANNKKPLIEKLESDAALIEASIDSYDELDAISLERTEILKDIEKKTEELTSAQDAADELGRKVKNSEEQLEELRYSGEELVKITGAIDKKQDRIVVLETLINEIEKTVKSSDMLKKQQDELEPVIDKAESLEAEYGRMLSAYMREQAGILAGTLRTGEPCPVCGSINHPAPAELNKDAPSEEEIEEKEKEAKAARDKASRLMAEAHKTKGNLETLMTSTLAMALRETGIEDLTEAGKSADIEVNSQKVSLAELREKEKELKEKSKKAEELNAALPVLRRSFEEKKSGIQEIEKSLNASNTQLAAVDARFQQVKKDLVYSSREEAENSMAAKASEAKRLRNDIDKAVRDANTAVSDKKVNDTKISELEKVVSGYEPVDEEAAAEAAAAALSEKEALTESGIQIASELKSAEAAIGSVKAGAEELERIRRDHEIIDALNRTANGSIPGKERITLESYVQSFYFERIIRRANIRLRMMSDGQYEFVKAGESGDKRHLSGLDLCVLDHYSGTERPVSTLSGGESFMASLSLALGLSDEVQASAGGIRLDTMFVDEGFGSLDSETLEKAIRTLTELSDEDKLVGIISHVDALKSRIDRQIVVTKDRDAGSRATVVI